MRFGGSVTAFSHPSLPSTSFSRAALSHRPAVVGLKSSLQPSDANSDELDEGIRSRGQHPLERGVGRRAALGALLIAAAASCGSSPANAEAKTRVHALLYNPPPFPLLGLCAPLLPPSVFFFFRRARTARRLQTPIPRMKKMVIQAWRARRWMPSRSR